MKPAAGVPKAAATAPTRKPVTRTPHVIHPVIVYPFEQPHGYADLEHLFQLVALLNGDRKRFARPITVLDRKTHYRNHSQPDFLEFRKRAVAPNSEVVDAWCVDTCQMWYCGLGKAFESGQAGDAYWLIPGDFNYGSGAGPNVLKRLLDLPEIIAELEQDLCIGEIATDHNHSKQLIDSYGTFALLYNWFPAEGKAIRQVTERPRSEFFALSHSFLEEVLEQRWYAYEQTVVMLLHAAFRQKRISRFFVGDISDLPEEGEPLGSAMQQIERTERVLKSLWRERNQASPDWSERFRILEGQSELIRRTAFIVLQNLLRSA